MTVFKRGILSSNSYYMEMIYHVNISIELIIASDGTKYEMCNELIFIHGMSECYYNNYV